MLICLINRYLIVALHEIDMTTSSRLLDLCSVTESSFGENVNCCLHAVSDLPPYMYGIRERPCCMVRSGQLHKICRFLRFRFIRYVKSKWSRLVKVSILMDRNISLQPGFL